MILIVMILLKILMIYLVKTLHSQRDRMRIVIQKQRAMISQDIWICVQQNLKVQIVVHKTHQTVTRLKIQMK